MENRGERQKAFRRGWYRVKGVFGGGSAGRCRMVSNEKRVDRETSSIEIMDKVGL
jgi:hypothetical protein